MPLGAGDRPHRPTPHAYRDARALLHARRVTGGVRGYYALAVMSFGVDYRPLWGLPDITPRAAFVPPFDRSHVFTTAILAILLAALIAGFINGGRRPLFWAFLIGSVATLAAGAMLAVGIPASHMILFLAGTFALLMSLPAVDRAEHVLWKLQVPGNEASSTWVARRRLQDTVHLLPPFYAIQGLFCALALWVLGVKGIFQDGAAASMLLTIGLACLFVRRRPFFWSILVVSAWAFFLAILILSGDVSGHTFDFFGMTLGLPLVVLLTARARHLGVSEGQVSGPEEAAGG